MPKLSVIAFRADASLEIGTGHIMRCLTLADALRAQGAICHFICRAHSGHLAEVIEKRDHAVHLLPFLEPQAPHSLEPNTLAHAHWLGASWQADAQQSREVLRTLQPNWLVVDHYALDTRWETTMAADHSRLLVIDDLADRAHSCDLLLDQNLGSELADYAPLVPPSCFRLIGPKYALLRPEFAQWRAYSLQRRESPQLKNILVTMGGVDKDNVTEKILEILSHCPLPSDCGITVVIGPTAPWLEQVKAKAAALPQPAKVMVNVSNMAELMANADLAIGAAGATSWERCCLGVPTLTVVLAENQHSGANALHNTGAAISLGTEKNLDELANRWATLVQQEALKAMSEASACITDGSGVRRVYEAMRELDSCLI